MPKRNYGFEKRQKELSRQQKREDKRQRRLDRTAQPEPEPVVDLTPQDVPPKE